MAAEVPHPTVTPIPPDTFSPTAGEQRLRRVLGVGSLRGFGLDSGEPLVGMAGALLSYVEDTQKGVLNHIGAFRCREGGDALVIDRASLRNLEVERAANGSRRGSLIDVLDHTRTRMGSRLLRDRLVRPSIDLEEITERHRAVAELVDNSGLLQDLRASLEDLPDLERLAARVGLELATPRELQGLRAGLDLLPRVLEAARGATSSLLNHLAQSLDPMPDLAQLLHRKLAAEPAQVPGAGVIAGGWDPELDEQRSLRPGRQGTAGGHRKRGTGAHRHRLSQGPLQQGLRLLHRGQQGQPRPGARKLRTPPDPDQRRALHHSGAQGARVAHPVGRGARDRLGAG